MDDVMCCMLHVRVTCGVVKNNFQYTNNKTAHYGEIIIDRDKFRILYFLIVQNKTDFSYRLIS